MLKVCYFFMFSSELVMNVDSLCLLSRWIRPCSSIYTRIFFQLLDRAFHYHADMVNNDFVCVLLISLRLPIQLVWAAILIVCWLRDQRSFKGSDNGLSTALFFFLLKGNQKILMLSYELIKNLCLYKINSHILLSLSLFYDCRNGILINQLAL